MGKDEAIVLREMAVALADGFTMQRQAAVHHGVFMQTLQLVHKGEVLQYNGTLPPKDWLIPVKDSQDGILQWTDGHWKEVSKEAVEIAQQALLYRRTRMSDRSGDTAYLKKVLEEFMLALTMGPSDEKQDYMSGSIANMQFPTTGENDRLRMMRHYYEQENMDRLVRTDKLEKLLFAVDKRIQRMSVAANAATGRDMTHLQDTAGENEFENEDAWRGDVHKKEGPEMKDTVPHWEAECKPELRSQLHKDIEAYMMLESSFMRTGSQIWLKVAKQMDAKMPVNVDSADVAKLEECIKKIEKMRKAIHRDEVIDHVKYDFRKFNKLMDDREDGVEARMRKVVALVSRPGLLEEEMRKGMPRQQGH